MKARGDMYEEKKEKLMTTLVEAIWLGDPAAVVFKRATGFPSLCLV